MKLAQEYAELAEKQLDQPRLDEGFVAVAQVYATLAQAAAILQTAGRHPESGRFRTA